MQQRTIITLLTCSLLLSLKPALASHILGSEIFYTIDANGNAEISVVLYRDCAGIAEPQVAIINAVSSCGDSLTLTANQTGIPGNDVWQDLPFDENEMVGNCPSSCTISSGRGVERFIYTVNVQLPSCGEWRFSQEYCCLSAGVNNLFAPGSYDSRVSTYAFLSPGQMNASPRFVTSAQKICVNSGDPILQSAYDLDGDSLVYSFCPLYHDWTTSDTIPFVSGASYSQPFPGQPVVIDAESGLILDTIISQAWLLIGVQVDEYRNGVLIGRSQRSSYLESFNCQITGSINTTVVQGTVVNGELQPVVGSEVIIEYSANVSNAANYYLYCTTCEHLEDYTWTTTTDTVNGEVTATLNWTPVAGEVQIPLHVRLLQASCEGDFSSTTMVFSIQSGTVTGIEELNEATISIYPNPSKGQVTVESNKDIAALELFDVSGRILFHRTVENPTSTIELQTKLSSGTYFVSIHTARGSLTKRLVVSE